MCAAEKANVTSGKDRSAFSLDLNPSKRSSSADSLKVE
jgi:hypothetical protein